MTAGIPGAGIGGLFYLLSALWMPFREAWLAFQGRSTLLSRGVVKRQVSLAVCILASLWATAWFLSLAITTLPGFAVITGTAPYIGKQQELPRLLSYSALALTLTTLVMILTSVQLLRLVVQPRRVCHRPQSSRRIARSPKDFVPITHLTMLALVLFVHPAACAQSAQTSESSTTVAQHLARADAAFEDEDSATAEREYRAVLALDSGHSHATFRLAQLLERSDRAESERLFRRYSELEPADPWGYIALAEFFAHAGRYKQALEWYAESVRHAPGERDAVLGRARVLGRSGRTDQAIETYQQWLDSHPDDDEAWRELARERWRAGRPQSAQRALARAAALAPDQEGTTERMDYFRRAAASAIEPVASFSWDSDGNARQRVLVGGDFAVGDGARLGIKVGRTRVSDDFQDRSFSDFGVTTRWRPRAAFQLDAAGGAVRLDSGRDATGVQRPAAFLATADVRARVSAPGGAARLDARFNRNLLDATSLLVANRIVRNEVRVRPDFAVSRRFRVRALGGTGSIRGGGERNTRYTVGGGAGWNPTPAVELSANYARISYAHPSRVGYFAPDRIQTVEAGSYMEFEGSTALLALDLGAGAERLQEHDAVFGRWRPSLRAYALLSFLLRPGRELRFEIEGYDTQAGPAVAPTASWKYGSAAVSFRWALP